MSIVGSMGIDGRIAPPPPGKLFIRDPAASRDLAIREQLAAYDHVDAEPTDHLSALAATLGEDRPIYVAVDSDWPYRPSAQP